MNSEDKMRRFNRALRLAIEDMKKFNVKPDDDFTNIVPTKPYQRAFS